jgi:hypothetical protein
LFTAPFAEGALAGDVPVDRSTVIAAASNCIASHRLGGSKRKVFAGCFLAFALVSCGDHNKSGGQAVDYGILGKPDAKAFVGIDAAILTRPPADTLALFRKNELSPPQGTADQPMNWDAIDEHSDYQRALFYSVAERAPDLIADQDRQWARAEEESLVDSSCDNAGSAGVRYQLSKEDCAVVVPDTPGKACKPAHVDPEPDNYDGLIANTTDTDNDCSLGEGQLRVKRPAQLDVDGSPQLPLCPGQVVSPLASADAVGEIKCEVSVVWQARRIHGRLQRDDLQPIR